ncbi:hypothetical protein [Rhizobium sp. TH2]|uniref:hypothetical protein n=1 Tax=Rhizobium sp. TH2 TaxID=2775403 RepID=UPI0021570214|nr:hypothetical protein [Rhizobium sp. TH2]
MMQHVRFRVVGGFAAEAARRWPCRDDVRQEAQRRINASGYTRYRAKALATGAMIPDAIRHFALQVNYVAEALSVLQPIPEDFQSDAYWPAPEPVS